MNSISNFWLSSFWLPIKCIRQIDKLCSTFLWSGPELNPRKAKIAREEVYKPKKEGGLGLRPLKEINIVCYLKLIWRIVSSNPSLWVKWIQTYLIRQGTLWSVHENTSLGSRKLQRMDIRNGKLTSFWYVWSDKGCLIELKGTRGVTDLGILLNAYVASVFSRRRRRHRHDILNEIESVFVAQQSQMIPNIADIPLWKKGLINIILF